MGCLPPRPINWYRISQPSTVPRKVFGTSHDSMLRILFLHCTVFRPDLEHQRHGVFDRPGPQDYSSFHQKPSLIDCYITYILTTCVYIYIYNREIEEKNGCLMKYTVLHGSDNNSNIYTVVTIGFHLYKSEMSLLPTAIFTKVQSSRPPTAAAAAVAALGSIEGQATIEMAMLVYGYDKLSIIIHPNLGLSPDPYPS